MTRGERWRRVEAEMRRVIKRVHYRSRRQVSSGKVITGVRLPLTRHSAFTAAAAAAVASDLGKSAVEIFLYLRQFSIAVSKHVK